jgi:DNA-binding NtrC family response regulator
MTMHLSPVLLIDDDSILLDTLASLLRLRLPDVQIETADSALAALERIRSTDYSVIICDAHQRRIEGVGMVRAVRKVHPEWPVLLLLEKHDEDLIRQAMNAGAYDVLVNPVEEGTLLFAMQRALEVSRLRSQVKQEEARLLTAMRSMMRDLEVLYGAFGLPSHFEAFMACVEADRQESREEDLASHLRRTDRNHHRQALDDSLPEEL